MVKIIRYIAWMIFLVLGIVGITAVSVFLHELYHFYDLKDVTAPGEICFMNLPTENLTIFTALNSWAGKYNYESRTDKLKEFEESIKYAELKAYSVQILFCIIAAVCFIIVLSEKVNQVLDEIFWENSDL